MRKTALLVLCVALIVPSAYVFAQDAKPAQPSKDPSPPSYSGMYSFLKEGEFLQLTVEDEGRVTGFVSRYEDAAGQRPFVNQFFKTGKLEGNKLTFTTQTVQGVWFEFNGTIDRGEGKSPGDEAYYVLNGALTVTENPKDAKNKSGSVGSIVEIVALKSFPQEK